MWYLGFVATLGVFAVLARSDFFAQTSIRVTRARVRRTGYLGRSASCSRSAIMRVIEVRTIASRLGGVPANWLLFLDSRDKTLLRAYAEYYPAAELWQLRETLNVSWDTLPDVRTFAQMRRDIPGSFPWTLAHIWLTLALVAVLALVIGGIIAAQV